MYYSFCQKFDLRQPQVDIQFHDIVFVLKFLGIFFHFPTCGSRKSTKKPICDNKVSDVAVAGTAVVAALFW